MLVRVDSGRVCVDDIGLVVDDDRSVVEPPRDETAVGPRRVAFGV